MISRSRPLRMTAGKLHRGFSAYAVADGDGAWNLLIFYRNGGARHNGWVVNRLTMRWTVVVVDVGGSM